MPSLVIGIDIGLSGALALLDANGLREVVDMPVMLKSSVSKVKQEVNPAGLNALLRDWVSADADAVLIVMESIASMPGQGVASMMSLGDSRGAVRGVVAARGYPAQWVTPQTWKKHYKLAADKELARTRAIELYPAADIARKRDHNRAEAMLIARYGWDCLR